MAKEEFGPNLGGILYSCAFIYAEIAARGAVRGSLVMLIKAVLALSLPSFSTHITKNQQYSQEVLRNYCMLCYHLWACSYVKCISQTKTDHVILCSQLCYYYPTLIDSGWLRIDLSVSTKVARSICLLGLDTGHKYY